MALPTIANDTPDHDLLKENTYPLVNLEANPLTTNLAAPFVLLQDDLLVSLSDENKLLLAVARAEARAWMLDFQIDLLVDALKPQDEGAIEGVGRSGSGLGMDGMVGPLRMFR